VAARADGGGGGVRKREGGAHREGGEVGGAGEREKG
jgi:hypothetical protein